MRIAITVILLGVVLLFCSAFVCSPAVWMEETASFKALVDGEPFQLGNEQLYRGLLVTRAASMDGKIPSRTVISTSFTGNSSAGDGRLIADNIQFEIEYDANKTGSSSNYAVTMQYRNVNYYMVKEQSKLGIVSLSWESDKKHFVVTSDFDCKMRSFNYPSDGVKDVLLKGRMSNIRITVPSWLAAKTN